MEDNRLSQQQKDVTYQHYIKHQLLRLMYANCEYIDKERAKKIVEWYGEEKVENYLTRLTENLYAYYITGKTRVISSYEDFWKISLIEVQHYGDCNTISVNQRYFRSKGYDYYLINKSCIIV